MLRPLIVKTIALAGTRKGNLNLSMLRWPSFVPFVRGVILALAWLSDRVTRAGEPWTAFFEPGPLAQGLRELGARRLLDLDGPAINERWFAGRQDGLHVGSLGRLIVAAT